MSKAIGLLLLVIIFGLSCPGPPPIVPIDFPAGDFDPSEFCIDFEQASAEGAVNGANAALLYGDLGIYLPSNPIIFNNSALCEGFQCLYQGDPGSARPEVSCGPLEIQIHPDLQAGKVKFEARNVGFISTPVEIVATAFGGEEGAEVEVDQYRKVSLSTLGDLRPVENVTVESSGISEPPITKLIVEYGTCPPHVVIDNLCFTPKERTVGTIGQSDAGADRLIYYFDNTGSESSIQLANLSNSEVRVHVQVWIANSTIAPCEEIDFYDTYTPKDVHTYDTLNLAKNNGDPLGISGDTLSGKYGFIVISKSDGPPNSLIGSMRIHNFNGFEYITNAVAPESVNTSSNKFGIVNFNNVNGNHFSELIGFTYTVIEDDTVYASSGISTVFGSPFDEILIFDENENDISCSPQQFSCSEGNANVGIDPSLRNPKDPDNVVCRSRILSTTNSAGWLKLPFADTVCTEPFVGDEDGNCMYDTYFVGFIGLAGSTVITPTLNYGTFDSWWGGKTIDEE
jgi:hypothetical protein